VLDDDPTGSQAVHGVTVVTSADPDVLAAGLAEPGATCFVLTNTRSLPEDEAVALTREVGRTVLGLGVPVDVVSRSDSTLRGHVVAEVEALDAVRREATGHGYDGVLLVPAYLEAGRATAGGVHWARVDGEWRPVGETEFAADATFGYAASDLRGFLEERSGGAIAAADVAALSLSDIREGGPARVAEVLRGVHGGGWVVVDATEYADLEVVVLGLLDAEAAGQTFVYRCGPSFVRVRGGIEPAPPLGADALYARRAKGSGHGLVLVGSHVETTTRQLEHALALDGVHARELAVERLLEPGTREQEIADALAAIEQHLPEREVILYTSRELARAEGSDQALDVGRSVSDALVELVQRLDPRLPLAFCVAKGGITSSDIGTRGFGVRRAEVAGQMLPGTISVWILPDDSAFPGLPYVIFPGNVGEAETLAEVIERLAT
jgi:uncharacterized protein YgbK (DUF1537 family)